jgi:hypothetical protein
VGQGHQKKARETTLEEVICRFDEVRSTRSLRQRNLWGGEDVCRAIGGASLVLSELRANQRGVLSCDPLSVRKQVSTSPNVGMQVSVQETARAPSSSLDHSTNRGSTGRLFRGGRVQAFLGWVGLGTRSCAGPARSDSNVKPPDLKSPF